MKSNGVQWSPMASTPGGSPRASPIEWPEHDEVASAGSLKRISKEAALRPIGTRHSRLAALSRQLLATKSANGKRMASEVP